RAADSGDRADRGRQRDRRHHACHRERIGAAPRPTSCDREQRRRQRHPRSADLRASGARRLYALSGLPQHPLHHSLLFNQLPYDPERDFTLITNLYLLVEALFVNSSLNVNTAAELKAYAQAHPSALNYGTLGPGSSPEMFLKWMNRTWN